MADAANGRISVNFETVSDTVRNINSDRDSVQDLTGQLDQIFVGLHVVQGAGGSALGAGGSIPEGVRGLVTALGRTLSMVTEHSDALIANAAHNADALRQSAAELRASDDNAKQVVGRFDQILNETKSDGVQGGPPAKLAQLMDSSQPANLGTSAPKGADDASVQAPGGNPPAPAPAGPDAGAIPGHVDVSNGG